MAQAERSESVHAQRIGSGRKSRTYRTKFCKACGLKLSIYNPGQWCGAHEYLAPPPRSGGRVKR